MEIVFGLFLSRGIAEDACNRLLTEGVRAEDVGLKVMRETSPVPQSMESELSTLSLDPLIFGDALNDYVEYIHNGETGVFVRAETAADIEAAGQILRLFEPVLIDVIKPRRGD